MPVADLLASLVAALVLVAVVAAVLAAGTVVPFVVGVDMAERRRFSPRRWGAVCLVGVLAGVAAAWLLRSHGAVALLGLVLGWATPALLAVLGPGSPLGGEPGAHER